MVHSQLLFSPVPLGKWHEYSPRDGAVLAARVPVTSPEHYTLGLVPRRRYRHYHQSQHSLGWTFLAPPHHLACSLSAAWDRSMFRERGNARRALRPRSKGTTQPPKPVLRQANNTETSKHSPSLLKKKPNVHRLKEMCSGKETSVAPALNALPGVGLSPSPTFISRGIFHSAQPLSKGAPCNLPFACTN